MPKSFPWPASRRIRRRQDFLLCHAQGKKFHSARFVIFAYLATGPGRVGFTVSRKVGNAVTRNRIKRVLRECFRLCEIPFAPLDLAVVAKKNAPGLALADAQAELYPLLRRICQCLTTVQD